MSKVFTLSLNDPWFKLIHDGTKKYEGRCFKGIITEIKSGDTIQFKHYTDPDRSSYHKTVVAVHKFKTFEEALSTLPISDILPNINSIDEGVSIYLKFVSLKTQLEYGVVMIEVSDIILDNIENL
jgi:ASC-1-like (ASCH) protein